MYVYIWETKSIFSKKVFPKKQKEKTSIKQSTNSQGRTWKKIDGRAPEVGRVQFVFNSYNFIQKY